MIEGLVSIVILSYNKAEYTRECLESIRKYTSNVPYEIIVIDNGSEQNTIVFLQEQTDIKLVLNLDNKGFAGGCNQGIQLSQGEYILLLNNDTVVTPNWLFNMVQLLKRNSALDMTGPLTNATVGKQMIPVTYGNDMKAMQDFAEELSQNSENPWKTLRLVAFCLLTRRRLFDEIGLLDEKFAVGNYEDDDFNIRALLANKNAAICRNSFIHHFMNISFQQKDIKREQIMQSNKLYLEGKWNSMDWNHHAVFNQYMLDKILKQNGNKILHIGCGLGALAIELKDRNPDYEITGIEEHPVRLRIAEKFVDEMISYEDLLDRKVYEKYDTIIVECMLEKRGIQLLESIKKNLKKNTIILLRVFNVEHITTIEKLVTGKIGGNLLCALSPEFSNYYGKNLNVVLDKMGYEVAEKKDVRKSFSNIQNEIFEKLEGFMVDKEEPHIYNRIFLLRLKDLE